MIRLICIAEQEDGHDFTVKVGQDYEPLDCKEIDGQWHYLIEKIGIFGYWYPVHMFEAVHYSDAELDRYIQELIEEVITENI